MRKQLLTIGVVLFVAATASAQTVAYDPSAETSVSGIIRYAISAVGPDGTVFVGDSETHRIRILRRR